MFVFICPICNKPLSDTGRSHVCENGHSFDKAKSGYVNLLMSQQAHTKLHGDHRQMLLARRRFLCKGYYDFLATRINELCSGKTTVLDIGCGEGYYTSLLAKKPNSTVGGIDISKDALALAAKDCPGAVFAVASINRIPVPDKSMDIVLNIFAPYLASEVLRILKNNGTFLKVIPLEKHLWELKQAVYDRPYENRPDFSVPEGMTLLRKEVLKREISVNNRLDLCDLFEMTPYCRKTSAKDAEKLSDYHCMRITVEFAILIFKKND